VGSARVAAISAAALVSVVGAAACGGGETRNAERQAQELTQVEQRVEQLERQQQQQQQKLLMSAEVAKRPGRMGSWTTTHFQNSRPHRLA